MRIGRLKIGEQKPSPGARTCESQKPDNSSHRRWTRRMFLKFLLASLGYLVLPKNLSFAQSTRPPEREGAPTPEAKIDIIRGRIIPSRTLLEWIQEGMPPKLAYENVISFVFDNDAFVAPERIDDFPNNAEFELTILPDHFPYGAELVSPEKLPTEEMKKLYDWLLKRTKEIQQDPSKIIVDPSTEDIKNIIKELSQITGIPEKVIQALCWHESLCRGVYPGLHGSSVVTHDDGLTAPYPEKFSTTVKVVNNSPFIIPLYSQEAHAIYKNKPPVSTEAQLMILPIDEYPGKPTQIIVTPIPLSLQRMDAKLSLGFGLLIYMTRLHMINNHKALTNMKERLKRHLTSLQEQNNLDERQNLSPELDQDSIATYSLAYVLYHHNPFNFINAQLSQQNSTKELPPESITWANNITKWATSVRPPWKMAKYRLKAKSLDKEVEEFYDYPIVKVQRWFRTLPPKARRFIETTVNKVSLESLTTEASATQVEEFFGVFRKLAGLQRVVEAMEGREKASTYIRIINFLSRNRRLIAENWTILYALYPNFFNPLIKLPLLLPRQEIELSPDPRVNNQTITDTFGYLWDKRWLNKHKRVEEELKNPEELNNLRKDVEAFVRIIHEAMEKDTTLVSDIIQYELILSSGRTSWETVEEQYQLIKQKLQNIETDNGKSVYDRLTNLADINPIPKGITYEEAMFIAELIGAIRTYELFLQQKAEGTQEKTPRGLQRIRRYLFPYWGTNSTTRINLRSEPPLRCIHCIKPFVFMLKYKRWEEYKRLKNPNVNQES